VLVVEDEDASRTGLRRLLMAVGYRVLAFASLDDALEAARTEPVDVLLTDLKLPQRRGDELAHDVCQLQPSVAVLFMSGEPLSATRVPGTFFEKPIDIDNVLATIEALRPRGRTNKEADAR
jgi:DNA-binding response OmpR family regulator